METSNKLRNSDLFSTDIDVIHRNIEFGTYKEIDPNLILQTNLKIESIYRKPRDEFSMIFNDYIYYEITDEQLNSIAKYLNIYYIDSDIDDLVSMKEKSMEKREELIGWVYNSYITYGSISARQK